VYLGLAIELRIDSRAPEEIESQQALLQNLFPQVQWHVGGAAESGDEMILKGDGRVVRRALSQCWLHTYTPVPIGASLSKRFSSGLTPRALRSLNARVYAARIEGPGPLHVGIGSACI
jgi:hypothetical protein